MPATFVARSIIAPLAVASLFLSGAASCAEQPRQKGDSLPGMRTSVSPEEEFHAQLGRTWELARLGDQELPPGRREAGARRRGTHPGPGTRPTIRFTADSGGALAGASGALSAGGWSFCNAYGAAYEVGPRDQLRFHGFQGTLVGCDGPATPEERFFRALGDTRRFEIDSATLSLIAADGSRLTFVAAPDSAGPP